MMLPATVCGSGPNSPAMMLASACADRGYFIPCDVMRAALDACAPRPYIDGDGALRAPEGYAFEFADTLGADRYGNPLKVVHIVPLVSIDLREAP